MGIKLSQIQRLRQGKMGKEKHTKLYFTVLFCLALLYTKCITILVLLRVDVPILSESVTLSMHSYSNTTDLPQGHVFTKSGCVNCEICSLTDRHTHKQNAMKI